LSEYLLGEEVLIAPVTEIGATEKVVVFPPGVWLSSLDGKDYEGPAQITFQNITIRSIPIFGKYD